MTIPDALIDRLRELLDKATPGPWARVRSTWLEPGDDSTNDIVAGHMIIAEGVPEADAALIAESRNALPELLAALEAERTARLAAEAERDGLESYLRACEVLPDQMGRAEAAHATGYREGVVAAANVIDCDCRGRAEVLAAINKNGAQRWNACGQDLCSALEAADIRALIKDTP